MSGSLWGNSTTLPIYLRSKDTNSIRFKTLWNFPDPILFII